MTELEKKQAELIVASKKIQTWIHTHPRKATIFRPTIQEFDNAISALESQVKEEVKCRTCNDEHWIITYEGRMSSPCPACGGGERYKEEVTYPREFVE